MGQRPARAVWYNNDRDGTALKQLFWGGENMAGPTPRPVAKAFAVTAAFIAIGLFVLFFVLDPRVIANAASEAQVAVATYMILAFLVSGGITASVVRSAKSVWPLWKIAGMFVLVLFAMVAVIGYGKMNSLPRSPN
jgi:hypothetical protein